MGDERCLEVKSLPALGTRVPLGHTLRGVFNKIVEQHILAASGTLCGITLGMSLLGVFDQLLRKATNKPTLQTPGLRSTKFEHILSFVGFNC